MDPRPTSNVSVDVLTLRYDEAGREVEIAVYPRATEPYIGQLALPGVTLLEGERLVDASRRAVATKLGVGVRDLGQLTVFDEPHRDPRGFTLSVVMWAVADDAEPHPDVTWHRLDAVPHLAFDHDQMVTVGRPLLIDRLWRNLAFTRALTGPQFPVSAAVAVTRSLHGVEPDRGNLNRRLASIPELRVAHKRVVLGRGRPGTLWEWADSEALDAAAAG
ncbi:NUDIX hydrolase [Propioniciclava soli]|uniref:NUDIX hydrolase n=1 Tax=Propioniciclava soli TaxID=2775081 RepID=A0ABZ3C6I2_9ACTN|nr:NUDIX hydrolase [Propioniciclava soli]